MKYRDYLLGKNKENGDDTATKKTSRLKLVRKRPVKKTRKQTITPEEAVLEIVELFPDCHGGIVQLEALRTRKELEKENQILSDCQARRLHHLKERFINDPVKSQGIKEMEVLEGLIDLQDLGSIQAETLHQKKLELATKCRLPDSYIQSDAASQSLKTINHFLILLSKATETIPENTPTAKTLRSKLAELKGYKAVLYQEIMTGDRALLETESDETERTGARLRAARLKKK